ALMPVRFVVLLVLMVWKHEHNVNGAQQREDQGLNRTREQSEKKEREMERHAYQWIVPEDPHQRDSHHKKNANQDVLAHDVSKQTEREREGLGELADNLERKH